MQRSSLDDFDRFMRMFGNVKYVAGYAEPG